MGKKVLIVISIIIVLLIVGGVFAYKTLSPKVNSSINSGPTINITYENFASALSQNQIVRDLPDNAVLLIQFYNFDSGTREIEKSFVMKKGSVVEGVEAADINIMVHSKYLQELTNKNFCEIIQKAKANGDMGTETSLSATSLMWKFRSMMLYRSCLGF